MFTREVITQALLSARRGPACAEHDGADGFLHNLSHLSPHIEPPTTPDIEGDIGFALLNRDAPLPIRKMHAKRAIQSVRDESLAKLEGQDVIDIPQVTQRAAELSDSFVNGVVQVATQYPTLPNTGSLANDLLRVLNPHKENVDDHAVAALVVFELFEPYLINKLLALDIYNPDILKQQASDILRDFTLLQRFYSSISHAVEFSVEGKSSLSQEELTKRLFDIGPIFIKMAQSFFGVAAKIAPENADFIEQIGLASQENITELERQTKEGIIGNLPAGLSLDGQISSASIAHVVKVRDDKGKIYADKVKRPHIKDTIADNAQTYQVLADVFIQYVEEHIEAGGLYDQIQSMKGALPFYLRLAIDTIEKELDFVGEAAVQRRAKGMLQKHPEIVIPDIVDTYSGDENIVMEIESAERIDALPANSRYLKNIAVLCIESWRNHLVHGDMHAGNVKGRADGSIVVYDWGKHAEITPGFVHNIERFLFALLRKDPQSIARAYCRIQSHEYYQASEEEVAVVAREVIAIREKTKNISIADLSGRKIPGALKDVVDTTQMLLLTLGLRHQTTMDMDYLTFMKSALEVWKVIGDELSKPQYKGKRHQLKALAGSLFQAFRDVYF